MNWYAITQLINGVLSLLASAFIYTRNKKNQTHITASLALLALATWCISYFLWQIQEKEEYALLWFKALVFAALFLHTFYLHVILSLTDLVRSKIRILAFSYLTSFVLATIAVLTPLYVRNAGYQKLIFKYWPDATPYFTAANVIRISVMLYGLYILYKSIKTSEGNKKNQFKILFIAFIIAWAGALTNLFLWYNIKIPPIGNIFITLFIVILAYAILRHKVLDINLVFRKGLIYSILVTIITVIYFISVYLLENLCRGFIGYKSTPLTLFIIVTFILLFQPLKNKIQYLVDSYFFKGTIDQIEQENIRLREELQRSEKLKSIGTLAAGMAHEIKNPLTSIKTFTEYLSEKCNDPEFIAKFQRIVTPEVNKINNIVTQLLDFAKPRALEPKDTDIQKLLDETLDLLSNDFIKYHIKLSKNYTTSPILKVDPNQLKQAFLNIILNSIDAMKEKGGRLTLSIKSSSNDTEISIEDTGCGINREDLKRLFDPFFSTKKTNTGLGLSIVHGIIEKHKGRISVDSSPGIGTRFIIYLPNTIQP